MLEFHAMTKAMTRNLYFHCGLHLQTNIQFQLIQSENDVQVCFCALAGRKGIIPSCIQHENRYSRRGLRG